MSTLKLGAPSLTGKDANELVKEAFAWVESWPAKFVFTNLVLMPLTFPEVSGLHLKPIGHDGEETVVASIRDYAALQRLASSIEQIAELNQKAELVEVGLYVDPEAELVVELDDDLGAKADELETDNADIQGENMESDKVDSQDESLEADKAASKKTNSKKG